MALFEHAEDCDKLAADLGKFHEEHKAEIDAVKAWEKASPDRAKAVQEKFKDKLEAALKKAKPGMEKCATNAKVDAAMKAMD